jgi:drug/metabolite transporter (DMT)-like permease
MKKDVKRAFHNLQKSWIPILLMCVANCIAWVTFSIAATKINFSVLSAISLCYPMIAIFLGVVINKEKLSKMQYTGAIIALLCSLLLGIYAYL